MNTIANNPTQLDGFAFLEFSGPEKSTLQKHFQDLGFTSHGYLKDRDIELFCQGQIKFILNHEADSQASTHAKIHGPGACSMGFKVQDAKKAYDYVLSQGATAHRSEGQLLPYAIEAIGGSVIYFHDDTTCYFDSFIPLTTTSHQLNQLDVIDHLTHNVFQGNMDKWANFYIELFNFSQIRYFDITGEKTGLISRAMGSPCGKIKIPLNESKDNLSQIEEFLKDYHGEGIQHIALTASNIYDAVENLSDRGIQFLDVPATYYQMLPDRINWHNEDIDRLEKDKILMDGSSTPEDGLLLQIFTHNMLGPAFFEIIQRKGNDGFGEGNFQALFEAIERDQQMRGVI